MAITNGMVPDPASFNETLPVAGQGDHAAKAPSVAEAVDEIVPPGFGRSAARFENGVQLFSRLSGVVLFVGAIATIAIFLAR